MDFATIHSISGGLTGTPHGQILLVQGGAVPFALGLHGGPGEAPEGGGRPICPRLTGLSLSRTPK